VEDWFVHSVVCAPASPGVVRSVPDTFVSVQGTDTDRLERPKVGELSVRLPPFAVIPVHHWKLEPSALRLALPGSQEFAVQASLSIGTGVPPESRRFHSEPVEPGISAPLWEGSDPHEGGGIEIGSLE
jgi:hypothetical protein